MLVCVSFRPASHDPAPSLHNMNVGLRFASTHSCSTNVLLLYVLKAGPCVAVEPGSEIIRCFSVCDPAVPEGLMLHGPWWLKRFVFVLFFSLSAFIGRFSFSVSISVRCCAT